jgi:hypothetical protein
MTAILPVVFMALPRCTFRNIPNRLPILSLPLKTFNADRRSNSSVPALDRPQLQETPPFSQKWRLPSPGILKSDALVTDVTWEKIMLPGIAEEKRSAFTSAVHIAAAFVICWCIYRFANGQFALL